MASCIATCSRCPLLVRLRLCKAARMLIAISMPVPVSPNDGPGLTGGRSPYPVTLVGPPAACAIMSKARFFSYGLPAPKPLTWQ